jgi:hypothetical protein
MGGLLSGKVALVNNGGVEDEGEEKDDRRRNSLAFYISQFVSFDGEDFEQLVEAVKQDKYAKSGGKPPKIRNSSK